MHPYRKEKLGSLVQEVISDIIIRHLNDPRVEPLTTVTRVEVSGDFLIAKVYLSIQGDEAGERRTLQAIRHATGYMQKLLAERLVIRLCPQLRFEIDQAAKTAQRTMKLIEENRRIRESSVPAADDESGEGVNVSEV